MQAVESSAPERLKAWLQEAATKDGVFEHTLSPEQERVMMEMFISHPHAFGCRSLGSPANGEAAARRLVETARNSWTAADPVDPDDLCHRSGWNGRSLNDVVKGLNRRRMLMANAIYHRVLPRIEGWEAVSGPQKPEEFNERVREHLRTGVIEEYVAMGERSEGQGIVFPAMFPAGLHQFAPNLVHVQLNDCNLTVIEGTIGQLTHLRILRLRGNVIRQLPSEIGALTRLRELDIAGNPLSRFPLELGRCTQLKYLHATDTAIEGLLPETFGDLERLKLLDLRGTEYIPDQDPTFAVLVSGGTNVEYGEDGVEEEEVEMNVPLPGPLHLLARQAPELAGGTQQRDSASAA